MISPQMFSPEARQFLAQHGEALGISPHLAYAPLDSIFPFVEKKQFVYRYISSLAISPEFASDRTVFAAVYNSGVFKSTNWGISWMSANEGLQNLKVKTLIISPSYANDQTLFVGVDTSSSTGGIFKSTDGGSSWIQFNFSPSGVQKFAISPNFLSDQIIFAASNRQAIMKSTNGGVTWSQIQPGGQVWAVALSRNYPTDKTIFVGADGVRKSTDDGITWTRVYGQLCNCPDFTTGSLSLSPNYGSDSTIFAGTYLGLIRSTNGGSSWKFVSPYAIGQIIFSPRYATDHTIFVVGAGGVFKSTNRGDSWVEVNNGLTNLSIEALAISPAYPNDRLLLAGSHDGVFRSQNETLWTAINNGIPLTDRIERITNSIFQIDTVPTIADDSTGALHVAWWGTYALTGSPSGITTDAFYTSNKNGAFEPPAPIKVPFGYFSISTTLAVDLDSYAHVAFRRGNSLSNEFTDALYYTTNRAGGFGNPILIKQGVSGPGGLPWNPSIAVDQNRKAHIAFVGLFSQNIWYTNNLAGVFMMPIAISNPEYAFSGLPSLAIDQSGNAHVTYRGESLNDSFGDIFYVNNFGGSFNSGVNVSQRSGSEDRPQLALDGSAKPHIVYEGFGTPGFYSFMESNGFSTPISISGISSRPSIALDKTNHVHIGNGGWYASNVNGAFNSLQIISADGVINVGPRCIAVSRDNIVHVVFAMPGSRIIGDSNYELYHIAFPIKAFGNLGDVNNDGNCNSTDALIILSFDVGLSIPQDFLDRIKAGLGDINADQVTNSTDALILLSFDAGMQVPFPVCQPVVP